MIFDYNTAQILIMSYASDSSRIVFVCAVILQRLRVTTAPLRAAHLHSGPRCTGWKSGALRGVSARQ